MEPLLTTGLTLNQLVLGLSIVLLTRSVVQLGAGYFKKNVAGVQLSWSIYLIMVHVMYYRACVVSLSSGSVTLDKQLFMLPATLLLMIVSFLMSDGIPCDQGEESVEQKFIRKRIPFFVLYIIFHIWLILVQVLVPSFDSVWLAKVLSIGVSLSLLFSKSYLWHISGSVAAWLITAYSFAIQLIYY